MKILWSILCIGVLLPVATNATEYNIKGNSETKKSKEIGIGISGGIFTPIRQDEDNSFVLEGIINPVVSGKISYRTQKHHLSCVVSYYPPMFSFKNIQPISVRYYIEVMEFNLIPAIFEYDFKGISFSYGIGGIIGYGALYSTMLGRDMKYVFSYPPTFGASLNISFTFPIRKNISISFDVNAKHYVFTKSDEPFFKMEGLSGRLGVEYYFPIKKAG